MMKKLLALCLLLAPFGALADSLIQIPVHPVQGGGGPVTPTVANNVLNHTAGNAAALNAPSWTITSGKLGVCGVSFYANPDFGTIAAGMLTQNSGTATIGAVTLDVSGERVSGGGGGQAYCAIYSFPITGSGTAVMRWNSASGSVSNFAALSCVEVTSADVSGSRVNATVTDVNDTGVTSHTPGSVATGGAGVLIGLMTTGNPNGTQTVSVPTNYTKISELEDDSQQNYSFDYRATGTNITDGPTYTIGTASDPAGCLAAYKSSSP